jgi:hypothetical protein
MTRPLLLSTLLALAVAQTTTPTPTSTIVSIYFGNEGGPMTASVISANPSVTAYAAHCSQYVDKGCFVGLAEIHVTDGSTYRITRTEPAKSAAAGGDGAPERLHYVDCTVSGSAVCTVALTVPSEGAAVETSMTIPAESVTLEPVTVTAGLDILASATVPSKGSATTTTTAVKGAGEARRLPRWTMAGLLGMVIAGIV